MREKCRTTNCHSRGGNSLFPRMTAPPPPEFLVEMRRSETSPVTAVIITTIRFIMRTSPNCLDPASTPSTRPRTRSREDWTGTWWHWVLMKNDTTRGRLTEHWPRKRKRNSGALDPLRSRAVKRFCDSLSNWRQSRRKSVPCVSTNPVRAVPPLGSSCDAAAATETTAARTRRAGRGVLQPRRIEGRPPALLVVSRELKIEPCRAMPTATCPIPDQESSHERRARSARSYDSIDVGTCLVSGPISAGLVNAAGSERLQTAKRLGRPNQLEQLTQPGLCSILGRRLE